MNQKGFIKDIVIIAVGILLLGGGYFYFSKKPAYAPAENTNQIADETKDWKTYRNEKYGYEFELPNSWGFIVAFDGSFRLDIPKNAENFVLGDKPYSSLMFLTTYDNNDRPGRYSVDWYVGFYVKDLKYEKNILKIGGVEAVELYIPQADTTAGVANRYTYIFSRNNVMYELGFFDKNSISNKIISTFKFTK